MFRFALALLALFFLASFASSQEAPATPDAALRSLFMLDAKEGWAVGDDGLVLHTLDGWESWELQRTGVRASLRCVQFLDAYVGFAVGVEALPYLRGTGGVVLATTDGGVSWKKLIHRELPGLHSVRFVDAENGYAFGDTNGGNPSGMFVTENGGKSWKPCSTLQTTNGWCAGMLVNDVPVAIGPGSSVGVYDKDQVLPLAVRANEQACLLSIDGRNNDVWAVGTQATVLLSRQTGGKSWEPVSIPVAEELASWMDFHAVCCVGEHVWIAGRPGSVMFHSPDRGNSWEVVQTSQPLPLHALSFVNQTLGFAVGEMGTILRTTDSGKSWKVMRRGGHRAAVLFASVQPQNLPLGAMTLLGGDQGYLCVGLQTVTRPGQWHSDRDRLIHAIRTVGGMTTDALTRVNVADYQQQMDGNQLKALFDQQHLMEQLVLSLRIWRPSVVVCDSTDASSPTGREGAIVALAMRQACELSARPDIYPQHLTKLGLQTWQPVKLYYGQHSTSEIDHCAIDLNLPRPVLFASANDFANLARPLVNDRFLRGPAVESFFLAKAWQEMPVANKAVETAAVQIPLMGLARPYVNAASYDLLDGITLGHGGQARREEVETDDLKYQLLLGATAKQNQDAKPYLVKMADPTEQKKFFSHFEHSLVGLAPMTVGDRIVAQAQDFANQGQWLMARECHLMLLDLLPTHRLAPESCRFITNLMGSSELRRRAELGQMKRYTDYVLRSPASKTNNSDDAGFERRMQTQRTILQNRRLELRRWNGGAIAAGEVYSVLHPLGFGDPDLQFCLLANLRQDDRASQSELSQSAFQWKYPAGYWHDAATSEQWLTQRVGSSPKPVMQAVRIPAMPRLDGKLDDEVWKNVPSTRLRQASGSSTESTEVRMAYDDTYLYVAVKCQQPAGIPVMQPVKPRKRDDDLRSYDRISLLFDLDRDYGTCFHLEFDARGCVMEECCGDITWNPQWFVEVCPTSEGWTAEVAIPLIELTGKMKLEGEVWAANVSRIIPGKGVQAVSLPAAVNPMPQGMGLLMFGAGETSPK